MIRRPPVALCTLLLALSVSAHADPVRAHYVAYAAGLNVINMDASIDLGSRQYKMSTEFQTAGTLSIFNNSRILTQTEGAFAGSKVAPVRMYSAGTLGGEPRTTLIDYRDSQPVIKQLSPPNDTERETVPAELQRNTIDTLSAMAELIQQVNETGRCDGSARVFDGRRLSELRAHTVATETLPPTSLSNFTGPALHCTFEGKMLAGFKRDESLERQQRLQKGSAWFAAITPGGKLVPVRISFQTRWFGDAIMYIAAPQ